MEELRVLRKYYFSKMSEKFILWFVWMLPGSVIKWASIRMIANATTGEYSNTEVVELTAMDALQRWD